MNVLYTGPNQKVDREREIGCQICRFRNIIKNSDFITINAAYNPNMHHQIDTEQFKIMKPTSYLINASRGPIVHEQALVQALKDKEIEGASVRRFNSNQRLMMNLKIG